MKKFKSLYTVDKYDGDFFWNYRFIKHIPNPSTLGLEWYGLHEVFYERLEGDVFKVTSWSKDSICLYGVNPDQIKSQHKQQLTAFKYNTLIVDHRNKLIGEEDPVGEVE